MDRHDNAVDDTAAMLESLMAAAQQRVAEETKSPTKGATARSSRTPNIVARAPSTATGPNRPSTLERSPEQQQQTIGPADRLHRWRAGVEAKLEKERRKLQEARSKEEEECTFQPVLSSAQLDRPSKPLIERQAEWDAKRQSKIQERRIQDEVASMADFTFRPVISDRARNTTGHLPLDIKQALHSPPPAARTGSNFATGDPASIAVRQENEYTAFVHRYAKAREEKARREALTQRTPAPASPRPSRTTVPVEPLFHTAARAMKDGTGSPRPASTSVLHQQQHVVMPGQLSTQFLYTFQQQQQLASDGQMTMTPNHPMLLGSPAGSGGYHNMPAHHAMPMGSPGMGSPSPAAWARYAPGVAALVAPSFPGEEQMAREAWAGRLQSTHDGADAAAPSAAEQLLENPEEALRNFTVRDLYNLPVGHAAGSAGGDRFALMQPT